MTDTAVTLYIDHVYGETRLALCDDQGQLHAYSLYRKGVERHTPPAVGDIFYARIRKITPAIKACFVDLGTDLDGFLPLSAFRTQPSEGQYLLVQIKQAAYENKGPALSTRLELTGRFAVLTPDKAGLNISRKINDPEKRAALKVLAARYDSANCGGIIRTHAQDAPLSAVQQDLEQLYAQWEAIQDLAKTAKKPQLALTQASIFSDYSEYPIEDVYFCAPDLANDIQAQWPHAQAKIGPLFEQADLESQIEALGDKTVPMTQGASLIIEETAACVAIDLNAGPCSVAREADRFTLNKRAIDCLKHQLPLRNLSGQIIVDLLKHKNPTTRQQLVDYAREQLNDSRTQIHGLSRLGLLEITRRRQGATLTSLLQSPHTAFFHLMRTLAFKPQQGTVILTLGSQLYKIWHQPENKAAQAWLQQRLGYLPQCRENLSLPQTAFEIGKDAS